MRNLLKNVLLNLPFFGNIYKDYRLFKTPFPPGHYANPYPSIEEVEKRHSKIFSKQSQIVGVNLNTEKQWELFNLLCNFNSNLIGEKDQNGFRYSFDNPMFSYADGIFLQLILRNFKPKRIIEVGSGHSSALMLDVNEHLMGNSIDLTFIEPYPERLFSLLRQKDKDKTAINISPIQDIPLETFDKLEENDILFLDTSHILKTGNDLNFELFNILPRLKKGVLIHIHDIFYPFEYPEEWIYSYKAYNEAYAIRAFLMYNDNFEIILWPSYLMKENFSRVEKEFPQCKKNPGASLWLKKVK